MANKITVVGQVTQEFLERFPNHPKLTIAKLMMREHPKLFTSTEQARRSVQYWTGCSGNQSRKDLADKKFVRPKGSVIDGFDRLPPPITELTPWGSVPITFKRALLLYDVHIPYHDLAAFKTALRHGRKMNVDCIMLVGDFVDFTPVSHWERDPRRRILKDELETAKYALELIREQFPKARIIFKEGNHEERLPNYLWKHAPELAEMDCLTLPEVLTFSEWGIEYVGRKQPIKANGLYILHGHEYGKGLTSPVNPARGLYMRTKANAICGHLHQPSHHSEAGLETDKSCWSSGCLCNLHPNYSPINRWGLGFATVELHKEMFTVNNHKIVDGQVV